MQLYATATNCQVPDWIYLSPHLDDAVFSCGGRIALQVRQGLSLWVVTVFSGSPTGPLSDFARLLHAGWGLEGEDAPAVRRKEDREALALLGAAAVHWDFEDCVYRRTPDGRWLYPDWASLWGPIAPEEAALTEALAQRLGALPPSAVWVVPLGAGRHVDHRHLRRAVEMTGRACLYYEDYPYADDEGAVAEALGEGKWESEVIFLDEVLLEAKIAAALRYRSQISSFWADEADLAAHFRAYALRVGGGRPAERYWYRNVIASAP